MTAKVTCALVMFRYSNGVNSWELGEYISDPALRRNGSCPFRSKAVHDPCPKFCGQFQFHHLTEFGLHLKRLQYVVTDFLFFGLQVPFDGILHFLVTLSLVKCLV